MRPALRRVLTLAFVLALLPPSPVRGHEVGHHVPVVIDTDLGLDDAAALAVALQSSEVRIAAVVATPGASGPASITSQLERVLDRFNRRDIALYAPPADMTDNPPPFRAFAEAAIGDVLTEEVAPFHRSFAADAYVADDEKTIVVALGPLTNLAAALRAEPQIARRIHQVVVAGDPEGWNVQHDLAAWQTVQQAELEIVFVDAGAFGAKPHGWQEEAGRLGGRTSIGATFLHRLWADAAVRKHYFETFGPFHDELAVLYLLDHHVFEQVKDDGAVVVAPLNNAVAATLFERALSRGRQRKQRVVFAERALPDGVLQSDVRARRARMLANNGPDEWFAQLLMNELHDHLGAYSVIGVKMGLRAAELLNAPPHAMRVVSHAPPAPPVSCINDGIIVGSGSTPGRALFAHAPGGEGVSATFTYNGRSVTLKVKPEYQQKIRGHIQGLLSRHTLEDAAYWSGVRALGLDIWENWHRCDLFEVQTKLASTN